MNHMNEANGGDRERGLKMAALVCLADLCLTGYAAFSSNSLTILSDFLKEGVDLASIVASILAMRFASRDPDVKYAYGTGKMENLASITIAITSALCAAFIAERAAWSMAEPEMPEGTGFGIAVFSAYAVIGFGLYIYNKRLSVAHNSLIISAQARVWFSKALSDAFMAIALGAGMFLSRYTHWAAYIDPIASLAGAASMMYSAWKILSQSVDDLLDATLEESLQLQILRALATHFEDYSHLHDIKARRSGSRIFIELTLEFEADLLMRDVREKAAMLRKTLEKAIPGAEISINLG